MKTKILLLSFLIVLMIVFTLTKLNFSPNFADIEIDKKFYKNHFPEIAKIVTYESFAKLEDRNHLTFPRTKPKKIILYSNHSFLKSKYELTDNESETLLKILNGSSKYGWGELGTPEVHYYFKYYNDNEELIGVTELDQEGMAYSEPYLSKMKWGLIADINEINKLIKKIEE